MGTDSFNIIPATLNIQDRRIQFYIHVFTLNVSIVLWELQPLKAQALSPNILSLILHYNSDNIPVGEKKTKLQWFPYLFRCSVSRSRDKQGGSDADLDILFYPHFPVGPAASRGLFLHSYLCAGLGLLVAYRGSTTSSAPNILTCRAPNIFSSHLIFNEKGKYLQNHLTKKGCT